MTTKPDAGTTPPAAEWVDPDDAPVLTEAFFADAEVFEDEKFVRRGRGRPPTGNAKELISVRLDRDVVAKLREAGPGWQSQVNGLLRAGLRLDQPALGTVTGVRAAGGGFEKVVIKARSVDEMEAEWIVETVKPLR